MLAAGAATATVWSGLRSELPRRALIALIASVVPTFVFITEYTIRIALAWNDYRVPAPYDCMAFFPALLGLPLGPPLLAVALRAIWQSKAHRIAYIAASLSAVLWITSLFFLLEGLLTIT